jgi:penicillin-binding protein 1B
MLWSSRRPEPETCAHGARVRARAALNRRGRRRAVSPFSVNIGGARTGGDGRGAQWWSEASRRWDAFKASVHRLHRVRAAHIVLAVLVLTALALIPAVYFYAKYSELVERSLAQGLYRDASNIYAASRTLRPGDKVTVEAVISELQRAGYSRSPDNPIGHYKIDENELTVYPGPRSYFRADPAVISFKKGAIARLVSADNKPLAEYSLEPELISNVVGGEREMRRLVHFKEIPPVLVHAVVSAEDKRFFEHAGFDPLRMIKAAYVDLKEHRKQQGASTLTMQLARALYLHPEKHWRRKFSELMITTVLEQRLSKEQIFEIYANQVYLGRYATYNIHGFGEAADAYFHKNIRRLDLPEAALLAGLIQRPSYFNPFRYPERAKTRRNTVLQLMRDNGYITAQEYAAAAAAPIGLAPHRVDARDAPYFLALMNDELQRRLPEEAAKSGAYQVYTTLDADLQRAADEAVRKVMPKIDAMVRRKHVARDGVLPQVALVALDPYTGEVKALVGGRNYVESQLNHAIAMRQPGSTFKPIVYAAALNTALDGGPGIFTEATTVMDEPTTFDFRGGPYEPGNFKNNYMGIVTLRDAMAHSLNAATVTVAERVGYDKVVAMAQRVGWNDRIQPTPAVALGAYETTPLELAGAYTTFANQGEYTQPTFLKRVLAPDGEPILEGSPKQHRALDPRVNYLMLDMLQEVMRSGTGAGVGGMGFSGAAAGKTGTSHDSWFVGFTPDLLCVVWVGYDDNRNLDIEGSHAALPIWAEFMRRVSALRPTNRQFPPPPDGLVAAKIDPGSGELAGPYCPNSRTLYFIAGTEPPIVCQLHPEPFLQVYPGVQTTAAPSQ